MANSNTGFDLSTASPISSDGGFDLSSAAPIQAAQAPVQDDPSYLQQALGVLANISGFGKDGNVHPIGAAERAAHLGSSAVAGLGGGLTYLGTLAGTGDPEAAKAVQEETQKALTYQPRTDAGKELSETADEALGSIPKGLDSAGAYVTDKTGSPLAGTAVNVGGNALLQALGARGLLKGVSRASIADAVTPSKDFWSQPTGPSAAPPIVPKLDPKTPAEQLQRSLENGKAVGYQVTPSYDPQAGFIDKLAQGVAGKANTEQAARVQNQGVTDALAARALGQDPSTLLTKQVLQGIRNEAVKSGYDPITNLQDEIPADSQFLRNNARIMKEHSNALSGNEDVASVGDLLNRASFEPAEMTDFISTLRARASDAYAGGRTDAGAAFKKQASELESLLDRHLQDLKDEGDIPGAILTRYRAARQLIAKSHTVEENLNPSTGSVDAVGIGSTLKNGKPLDGDLKTIADFANSAPSLVRVPQGSPLPTSPLNTAAGLAMAHGSGGVSLALIPAIRGLAAKLLTKANADPASLQPPRMSLAQSALDAVHGSAAAFDRLYGDSDQVLPATILATRDRQGQKPGAPVTGL